MNPAEAIKRLKKGDYCLWVGSGITTHLSSIADDRVPGWQDLVVSLERSAKVDPPPDKSTMPERLSACLRKLRRTRFQQALRAQIHHRLASAVIQATLNAQKLGTRVPTQALDIARLGCLANPIVNFNIETYTSKVLASSSQFSIKVFSAPDRDAHDQSYFYTSGSNQQEYYRAVYHPHGALDMSGLCVMTTDDYQALSGTLGLELATHAAFQSTLAIVGMSLDDEYLRAQLSAFRGQLGQVLWFRSGSFPEEFRRWAWRSNITIVDIGRWDEFWQQVRDSLPLPTEKNLVRQWVLLLNEAINEVYRAGPTTMMVNAMDKAGLDVGSPYLDLLVSARRRGEGGRQPQEVPKEVMQAVFETIDWLRKTKE